MATRKKATPSGGNGLSVEQIAEWAAAQSQPGTVAACTAITPAPRHASGRGSEMSADEINEIRMEFLCNRLSRVQLAEKFGRTRATISRCLEGKEFEELRRTLDLEVREELRRRMIGKASDAVGHWERSMGNAADRGDHKPSKDWLLHAGVVDPVESTEAGPKVVVQIGVSADKVLGLAASVYETGSRQP